MGSKDYKPLTPADLPTIAVAGGGSLMGSKDYKPLTLTVTDNSGAITVSLMGSKDYKPLTQ